MAHLNLRFRLKEKVNFNTNILNKYWFMIKEWNNNLKKSSSIFKLMLLKISKLL